MAILDSAMQISDYVYTISQEDYTIRIHLGDDEELEIRLSVTEKCDA